MTQETVGTHLPARRWLTTAEAAAYLSCSKNFLDRDRLARLHGIPFARLGRHIRYDLADLDQALLVTKQPIKDLDAK